MIKLGRLSFNRGAWRCRSIAEGENADGELEFEAVVDEEVEEGAALKGKEVLALVLVTAER